MLNCKANRETNMRQFIILFIFYLWGGSAFASEWTTFTNTDEMTDKKTVFASIENDGSSFFVYTDKKRKYIGGFLLIGYSHQIHYEPKLIMMRVDKNEPYTIAIGTWEPRKIYFDLTYYTRLTDEIMRGKALVIQYPVSRTTKKVQKFSLKNSEEMIKKALINYESVEEIEESHKAKEKQG